MNEFDNDIGDVERTNRVNHAFHLALKSSKKFLSEEICNQVVIMGKKETKIILDQSDDQCMVELEPLNPDEVYLYVFVKVFPHRLERQREVVQCRPFLKHARKAWWIPPAELFTP